VAAGDVMHCIICVEVPHDAPSHCPNEETELLTVLKIPFRVRTPFTYSKIAKPNPTSIPSKSTFGGDDRRTRSLVCRAAGP
jgi:hypothetical protein